MSRLSGKNRVGSTDALDGKGRQASTPHAVAISEDIVGCDVLLSDRKYKTKIPLMRIRQILSWAKQRTYKPQGTVNVYFHLKTVIDQQVCELST